ncbi:hypothetical protein E6C70_07310 [Glaciibacter flavus]|uniref:Integral membrane protein n=1 Tax=Orlajensenia flava TaxID=2565934 RepID=A0A4S4G0C6_9MICO|nr:DUF6350 family protein [Glaciibacter flavus]THG35825.1 hypothetical protein E6C70_07310 [Glaciibacter flavus]
MNRTTTALLAALEAFIAVAVGLAIPTVALTVVWGVSLGMGVDWIGFWRAAADVWLLGHGVDVLVTLPSTLAAGTGLPGAEQPFFITIALLGFGTLTAVFGVRVGRRAAISGSRMVGILVAVIVFAALTAVVLFSAGDVIARPSRVQGLLLPVLLYAAAAIIGSEWESSRLPAAQQDGTARTIRRLIARWPAGLRSGVAAAARGATVAVSGIIAAASVLVTIALVTNYSTITSLYETLHAGAIGGAAITVLQLALLPNVIVWAASWLIGPGFALGVGTAVSPAGTTIGTLPGLPLFGALPHGAASVGWLGLVVPVLLGAAGGWVAGRRLPDGSSTMARLATGLGAGAMAGIALGVLAWFSGGAVGPGRLAQVGPDPWVTGALAAVEVGVPAALLAVLAGLRGRWADEDPEPQRRTSLPSEAATLSR